MLEGSILPSKIVVVVVTVSIDVCLRGYLGMSLPYILPVSMLQGVQKESLLLGFLLSSQKREEEELRRHVAVKSVALVFGRKHGFFRFLFLGKE